MPSQAHPDPETSRHGCIDSRLGRLVVLALLWLLSFLLRKNIPTSSVQSRKDADVLATIWSSPLHSAVRADAPAVHQAVHWDTDLLTEPWSRNDFTTWYSGPKAVSTRTACDLDPDLDVLRSPALSFFCCETRWAKYADQMSAEVLPQ